MKVQGRAVEAFLRRPDPATPVVLLHGPDAGLVAERAVQLARTIVDDLGDPFRVSELEPDRLRDEPHRLLEEAQALCLMGGRRVVRVRPAAGDGVHRALELLLTAEPIEALVVIEAEDFQGGSKLRQLAERSPKVAVVACWREEGRDLAGTVREMLAELGLRADAEATEWLTRNLGADKGVTRRELEKLALYLGAAAGQRPVTLAEAAAVVGDSSALGLDDLAAAVLLSDAGRLERTLARLLAEGQQPVALLRAVASQLLRLLRLLAEADGGRPFETLLESARPPVHFRTKNVYRAAYRRWSPARLTAALAVLQAAEIDCKRAKAPGALLCRRALATLLEERRGAA